MSEEVQAEFSAQLGDLAKALAAAQLKMQNAGKDAVNPHFKNKYATLASVREAVTQPLAEQGISIAQLNEPHGDAGVCVITLMMHSSGQWIRSRLFVPASKKDAQGFGSALSYARRYALASICNIATDDDDDGNQAARPSIAKAAPQAPVAGVVEGFLRRIEDAEDQSTLAVIGRDVQESPLGEADRTVVRDAYVSKAKKVGK